MTASTIIHRLIREGLALNRPHAAAVANLLKLHKMKSDAVRLERARLYRAWRKAGEKKNAAATRAINGEPAPKPMFEEEPNATP